MHGCGMGSGYKASGQREARRECSEVALLPSYWPCRHKMTLSASANRAVL
jgi:hypothetical protein